MRTRIGAPLLVAVAGLLGLFSAGPRVGIGNIKRHRPTEQVAVSSISMFVRRLLVHRKIAHNGCF